MLLLLKFHIVNLLYKVQIRNYSSKANQKVSQEEYKTLFDSLDKSFIQWFVGFSDAESNFQIKLTEDRIQLMFQIGLHWDDLPLLTYLKDKLQCGYITQSTKEDKANFVISSQAALKGLLVPLFDSFTLNTTKYLDYLAFREAVMLCDSKAHLTSRGREKILSLKASMNSARTVHTLPINHKVEVTYPWLLGLIEGDGCFSFNGLVPRLSIQLNLRQENVLIAIKEFFGGIGNIRREKVRTRSEQGTNNNLPMVIMEFNQIAFLRNVIIPGFKALTFLSKKGKDFEDWLICVEIYFSGRHTLSEGEALILRIKSRMNNNRLSTNPNNQRNLVITQSEIENLFALAAPYEVRNGVRFISGTDKLVPESFPVFVTYPDGSLSNFPSLSQCALALGISRKPIRKYLDSGIPYNGYFFSSTPPGTNL